MAITLRCHVAQYSLLECAPKILVVRKIEGDVAFGKSRHTSQNLNAQIQSNFIVCHSDSFLRNGIFGKLFLQIVQCRRYIFTRFLSKHITVSIHLFAFGTNGHLLQYQLTQHFFSRLKRIEHFFSQLPFQADFLILKLPTVNVDRLGSRKKVHPPAPLPINVRKFRFRDVVLGVREHQLGDVLDRGAAVA